MSYCCIILVVVDTHWLIRANVEWGFAGWENEQRGGYRRNTFPAAQLRAREISAVPPDRLEQPPHAPCGAFLCRALQALGAGMARDGGPRAARRDERQCGHLSDDDGQGTGQPRRRKAAEGWLYHARSGSAGPPARDPRADAGRTRGLPPDRPAGAG